MCIRDSPLAGEARVRILQITDTHLFAQKHEALLGVNTWESYQAVLEAIRPHQHEFDLDVYKRQDQNHIIVPLLCDHMNISEKGYVKFMR